jgi:hypothetical protein
VLPWPLEASPACGLVDESFGVARALRDVPTLSGLSPTGSTGSTNRVFISYGSTSAGRCSALGRSSGAGLFGWSAEAFPAVRFPTGWSGSRSSRRGTLCLQHAVDDGCADDLDGQAHFSVRGHSVLARYMWAPSILRRSCGKSWFLGSRNRMTTTLSSAVGMPPGDERIRRVHQGHALQVDVTAKKLRDDEVCRTQRTIGADVSESAPAGGNETPAAVIESAAWPRDRPNDAAGYSAPPARANILGAAALRFAHVCPAAPQPVSPSFTSSVQTLKLFRVLGPKVLLMATSAASRPRAINTRPMRGVLLRASKVYQWPSR